MTNARDCVFEILARRTGLNASGIRMEARLLDDLKLDGDDAVDAILEISRKCGVDISGFDSSQYFRSEPSLLSLLRFLPSQRRDRAVNKLPLTVADLVRAAIEGKLIPRR